MDEELYKIMTCDHDGQIIYRNKEMPKCEKCEQYLIFMSLAQHEYIMNQIAESKNIFQKKDQSCQLIQ